MKTCILVLASCICLLAGCADGAGSAPGHAGTRAIRLLLDLRSAPGSTLADDMYKSNEPMFEQLRTRGLPDQTVNELERYMRRNIEDTINNTIVPIYNKAFTPEELDSIAAFLNSPGGKEFSNLSHARVVTSTATILANAAPEYQAPIREFLMSPAGRKYITTSKSLYDQSRNAVQEAWVANASLRQQEIQQILSKPVYSR